MASNLTISSKVSFILFFFTIQIVSRQLYSDNNEKQCNKVCFDRTADLEENSVIVQIKEVQ